MCKFHKDVAREIATDPTTGTFDPLAYSIGLSALAKFWIDRYMPDMSDCDGYSNYEMASLRGVRAFDRSGLSSNLQDIENFKTTTIGSVRDALASVISENGLTLEKLNLPKNPVRNSRFLDQAMCEIYQGDPAIGLELRSSVDKAEQEPLRLAVEKLTSQPGIDVLLQKLQEGSFGRLFTEAKEKVNPTLLSAYEKIPSGLTKTFRNCAMCAGSGTGGALVSHAGCVLVPVFAGASGSALSAQLMSAMLVTSPVIAGGVTAGIDRLQHKGFSFLKVGASAALGLAIATGVNAYGGHDHRAEHHDQMELLANPQICGQPHQAVQPTPNTHAHHEMK